MSREYEELKKALSQPANPESMQQASRAFANYRQVELSKGHNSTPTLVTLSKGLPAAVPVDQIPQEIATNPEFYNLMRKIVAKER